MTDADQLVADYLKELDKAMAGLPRSRREEVVAETAARIARTRAAYVSPTEADVQNMLAHLGEPAAVAADARGRFGVGPDTSSWRETATLVLLPIGGVVVPGFGWLVAVVLLWGSKAWTWRDKLIGTLILPGGLLFPFLAIGVLAVGNGCTTQGAGASADCTAGGPEAWQIATMVVLFLAPVASVLYLARRIGRLHLR